MGYANAVELFELFEDSRNGSAASGGNGETATTSILSERGRAYVDERTNSIILTDTEEKIESFRELIRQIDIPIQQVLIEARIVTASADFARDLGVEWSAGYLDVSDDGTTYGGGNIFNDLNFNNGVLTGDFGAVDLGASGAAGDIAFGYVTEKLSPSPKSLLEISRQRLFDRVQRSPFWKRRLVVQLQYHSAKQY